MKFRNQAGMAWFSKDQVGALVWIKNGQLLAFIWSTCAHNCCFHCLALIALSADRVADDAYMCWSVCKR